MRKFKLGWRPDKPDFRDHVFKVTKPLPLPPVVDLRATCSPVEDQGDLGSCTAHALTAALEFLEIKDKLPAIQMSRLFVYYNERDIEGDTDQDNGAEIRDGIKSLADKGCCGENFCPYDPAWFTMKPSQLAYADAADHKITQYNRLNTISDMQQCLAQGFPFVFGFTVYGSFQTDKVAATGEADLPKKDESAEGGHAVMCVGYDLAKARFLIRNSWGTDWGMKGYFTLPFKYLEDRGLSDDFWAIYRGTQM